MPNAYSDIAFTETILKLQEEAGSRAGFERFEQTEEMRNAELGPRETAFIEARDSFYMASLSESGWPYVQHRGGPVGFVRILGSRCIGFGDFRGNRQYVSLGNLTKNDRVSFFFMDYANKIRLKLFGHARLVEGPIAQDLAVPGYGGVVERGFLVDVAAFDWNCPQHITERFSLGDVQKATEKLTDRIAYLERQLAEREDRSQAR